MMRKVPCKRCGEHVVCYMNPVPTVDIVIYEPVHGVVLIDRKNEPHGWALPGGFIDYGESAEAAAVREAFEETSLHVTLIRQLGAYSDPTRDPRQHTISIVFLATCNNTMPLRGRDDALSARFFTLDELPSRIAFDHHKILTDFAASL